MNRLILYIGNKNYSSWSFRGWAILKMTGVDFDEVKISLYNSESSKELLKFSPSGKVPCLHHGDVVVWDSISIVEYLNEIFPDVGFYPKDAVLRDRV
jgi:glutathione S-transferase